MILPRLIEVLRQLGDLRVLRGVVGGVADEARTRGFPSLPLDRFGFFETFWSKNPTKTWFETCINCSELSKRLI